MKNIDYMKIALKEAQKAYKKGEVPVGAVIVKNDHVVAKAHNLKEKKHSVLGHAELIAIEKASKKQRNWRLDDCQMFITLEPCPMCASAIQQSRISEIYYGTTNTDLENQKIITKIFNLNTINKAIKSIECCENKECAELLKNFFKKKRKLR